MRVNVYVDGFNLYYRALRGTPYKWLDLEALGQRLAPDCDINRIRYFTARIAPSPDDPHARRRQYIYLRALATNPRISVHFGRFQRSRVRMALVAPRPGQPRTVEVHKTEEKGTDVNLASYLLLDAFRSDSDLSIVVSNDADLAEPIRILIAEFGARVGIAVPSKQACAEFGKLKPLFTRVIREEALRASQLPYELRDSTGIIRCPDKWRLPENNGPA